MQKTFPIKPLEANLPPEKKEYKPFALWNGAMEGAGKGLVPPLIVSGYMKFRKGISYREAVTGSFTGWIGKINMAATSVLTIWGAFGGYKKAKEHNEMLKENIAMRQQLNQTGQVRPQVADKLDGQANALTANIETLDATMRAQTQGTPVKAPAASYAEKIQAEKQVATEAQPTIH